MMCLTKLLRPKKVNLNYISGLCREERGPTRLSIVPKCTVRNGLLATQESQLPEENAFTVVIIFSVSPCIVVLVE